VDTDHQDIVSSLVDEACICTTLAGACCPGGATMAYGPGSAEDDIGHGTNVTGIITSDGIVADRGVAPDADGVVERMMNTNSFGGTADIVLRCICLAVKRKQFDIVPRHASKQTVRFRGTTLP
jgi:subtilisin family serine protease